MSGVQAKGWDTSTVVACQILDDVPCHVKNSTLMLYGNVSTPMIANVRGKNMEELNDLSQDEILQVANALRKLDCNSIHAIFHHPKIQVLHPYALKQTLHSCIENQTLYTHEQLIKDLQSIVSPDSS